MSLPSFRLLRPYAIYRITYVGKAPTNPVPIVFPIYIGPSGGKMHALVLNPRNMSSFDIANMVQFIRKMSKVGNAYRYNGRLMYRILRQYLPQIVSKCYRTYFTTGVKRYALISTGIVPPDEFTNAEKAISDISLHQHAQKSLLVKSLNLFTGTKVKSSDIGRKVPEKPPPQPSFYEPYRTPARPQRDVTTPVDNSTTNPNQDTTQTDNITTDTDNGLEGYN